MFNYSLNVDVMLFIGVDIYLSNGSFALKSMWTFVRRGDLRNE